MEQQTIEWPITFLVLLLASLLAAAVLPWIPELRQKSGPRVLLPAIGATLVWFAYEMTLRFRYPPDDPLIRVDLFLLIPLALIAWISTLLAAVPPAPADGTKALR